MQVHSLLRAVHRVRVWEESEKPPSHLLPLLPFSFPAQGCQSTAPAPGGSSASASRPGSAGSAGSAGSPAPRDYRKAAV